MLGEQSMKSLRGRRGEDLIFNGGDGASRASKASVRVTFDNTDHTLDDSFDEVTVSRTVRRDGSNEYAVNGTQVRHRDIVEMLAGVNIGATGHHIISQGEADSILNASPEERKEILEDGLGLKLLQYRRAEAEKKLERARQNIAETDLLIRELTPHMRHLKRQVERYKKARAVRTELESLYADYLARETRYIAQTTAELEPREHALARQMADAEKKVSDEKHRRAGTKDDLTPRIQQTEKKLAAVREKKDAAARELGRAEGEHSALERLGNTNTAIERKKVLELRDDIQHRAAAANQEERSRLIDYIIGRLTAFLKTDGINSAAQRHDGDAIRKEQETLRKTLERLSKEEQEITAERDRLREQQEERIGEMRKSESAVIALMDEKAKAERELSDTRRRLAVLREDETQLRRELEEGAVLVGPNIYAYKEKKVPETEQPEKREKQKERQRQLERKKIQLETIGTDSGEDAFKEHDEVKERMDFLTREKDDLLKSIADCEQCIKRVQKEVDSRFAEGIKKISGEFESFFKILFGGGTAAIITEKTKIEKDNGETEERIGVEVKVSLPRKKIRSLSQLSGGERALVSIALLFAISQVTPPPFLVLDETDAALDEANSRRYASIIEVLAKRSQLILVTHNRETMHCAGALYGITMNAAGISTLLSVQFDEAVQVAK